MPEQGGNTKSQPGGISDPNKPSSTFLYAGLSFMFVALAIFIVAVFSLYQIAQLKGNERTLFSILSPSTAVDVTKRDIYNFYGAILTIYLSPLLLIISASLCAFIGNRLLRSAGALTREVIPSGEYNLLAEAIQKGDEKAISEYIRLSSLCGMTATFTKIGLTGLPLATIALTIILAFLGLFNQKFFDLAQLTLGAFIGSYVQKKREEGENHQQVTKG
jgi:hypothetical protein